MAINRTIESFSVKPKIVTVHNRMILDLNEFRAKGFSLQTFDWDLEQNILTMTFRDDGNGRLPDATVEAEKTIKGE